MPALPYHREPLAPEDATWDAAREVGEADVDDLKKMCAWVGDDETVKSSYKLPHHTKDGYRTVKAGVVAAGNAIMGARGGVKIPESELAAVKTHLGKHYKEFDMTPPWEKSADRSYQTKQVGGKVVDVDTVKGVVVGYFASFNTLDSQGDIFAPGAFTKTLSENKARIMHLLQHNTQLPLARPDLSVDDYGLKFMSTISPTSYGRDTVQLYADGVYNEHSVGFEELASVQNEEGDNVITEVKLWEGSTVTWGANENTPVESVKRLSEAARRSYCLERMGVLTKALHRGNMTDDTYVCLEIELMQMKTFLSQQAGAHDAPGDIDWSGTLVRLSNLRRDINI